MKPQAIGLLRKALLIMGRIVYFGERVGLNALRVRRHDAYRIDVSFDSL